MKRSSVRNLLFPLLPLLMLLSACMPASECASICDPEFESDSVLQSGTAQRSDRSAPHSSKLPAPTERPSADSAEASAEFPSESATEAELPESTADASEPAPVGEATQAPDPAANDTTPCEASDCSLDETTTTDASPSALQDDPPAVADPFVYRGLVELCAIDDSFVIDQRYATTNNFTGIQQYDRELCLVQQDIVDMLIEANDLAKQYGLRLKIWDAYRPISVQQALHDSAPAELAPYVPAPGPYSMHARGITVDLTLCFPDGTELDMPTVFDDFSVAANSDYEGATEKQIANRELLNTIMSAVGFQRSKLEWWHFDGPNRDNYEILDLSFAEFEAARDSQS